ncbi:MAG: GNAT family N-acetyltransferase [Candidatus Bathyarchaeia archaeon]|jgi:hypothetical protein
MILTISDNQTIIGIAPLKTRKNFTGRHVDFLHPLWFSDFIFDEQHRNACIKYTFDFLFNTLKCGYASLILPGDSPNLELLEQQCKVKKIHLKATPEMGRRIIPVTSTIWAEFEALRKGKFRKELKRRERNLNKAGSWTTMCVEGNEKSDIFEKILNVERKSWKQKWRVQSGTGPDSLLLVVLKAAQRLAKIEPSFKWNTWFMELNGKTIAYTIVIEYKGIAYIVKTSYDENYKRLCPGIVIQNSVIQGLLTKGQRSYIDFISDLPYQKTWTSKCLPRVKVQLTKGAMPIIIQSFKDAIAEKVFSRFVPFLNRQSSRSSIDADQNLIA